MTRQEFWINPIQNARQLNVKDDGELFITSGAVELFDSRQLAYTFGEPIFRKKISMPWPIGNRRIVFYTKSPE